MSPHGFLPPVRGVDHLNLCRPVIIVVEIPALKNFPVIQRNLRTGRQFCLIFQISRKVLSHVQHGLPGRGVNDFLHGQTVLDNHRQAVTVRQLLFRQDFHGLPGIVLPRPEHAVQVFPVIDIRKREVASPVCPASVGKDHLLRPVCEHRPQFRNHLEPVSVDRNVALVSEPSLVPSVSGQNLKGILPFPEQCGHVVGFSLHRLIIVVAERRQQILPGLLAVQIRFIQPQPGNIQPGAHRR